MTYTPRYLPTAQRALSERLPEAVAAAAFGFISGSLCDEPHRVGKPLGGDLQGLWSARRGTYRIIYRIDDEAKIVTVVNVAHRRDAYR